MAYNASNDVHKVIETYDKNQRGDKIQIARVENKTSGVISVDVRNMYTDESGEVKPTSKGIRINSEMLVDVMESMLKAGGAEVIMEMKEVIAELEQNM